MSYGVLCSEWSWDSRSRARIPREENLVDVAKLLAARRGDPVRIETASDPAYPESHLYETGALLPGPNATLAGPTFEECLDPTS
jgi:hypothetical protein